MPTEDHSRETDRPEASAPSVATAESAPRADGAAPPPGAGPGVESAGEPGQAEQGAEPSGEEEPDTIEAVEQPAKVMRIGSMTKQLLDEVRQAPLDAASRTRLREIYETSVRELAGGLSPDLASELDRLAFPFESETPSEAELRVAQAQLVGWLEGLFHGIQATLFAQQMAARSQLDEMRQRGLPPGEDAARPDTRPGVYL